MTGVSTVRDRWDTGTGTGTAYLGVAFAEPSLWPSDGRGRLDDLRLSAALLRNGLGLNAQADLGQPLSASTEAL